MRAKPQLVGSRPTGPARVPALYSAAGLRPSTVREFRSHQPAPRRRKGRGLKQGGRALIVCAVFALGTYAFDRWVEGSVSPKVRPNAEPAARVAPNAEPGAADGSAGDRDALIRSSAPLPEESGLAAALPVEASLENLVFRGEPLVAPDAPSVPQPGESAPALTLAVPASGGLHTSGPVGAVETIATPDGTKLPVLVERVEPQLPPDESRRAGAFGIVQVRVSVDEFGKVSGVRAVSGEPWLRRLAESAALQWRYRPAVRDGIAVAAQVVETVDFPAPTVDEKR